MKYTTPILLIIVLVLAVFSQPNSEVKTQITAFEYKFEPNCNERKANDLGAIGWELIAISNGTYAFKRIKK